MNVNTLRARRQDLRDAIWTAGPEHFAMHSWFATSGGRLGLLDQAAEFDVNACGTTACAAGHGVVVMAAHGVGVGESHHDAVQVVADWFDLDAALFWRADWHWIEHVDGDLDDRYFAHRGAGHDVTTAEWLTILDHLDALIKADEP